MKIIIVVVGVFIVSIIGIAMVMKAPSSSLRNQTTASSPPMNDVQDTPTPSLSPEPTLSSTPEIATPSTKPKTGGIMQKATIATSKGNISVELYPEDATNTVKNFLAKAKSGFYTNLTFHRVEDWVIQGGDPLGTGTGGGNMPSEFSQRPFGVGSLGVARGGDPKISNDSQFFICTKDCSWLTGQYTNFGTVLNGMDVALKIAKGDTILSVTIEE